MGIKIELNGQQREFETLQTGDSLETLILQLELKGDRVAVERNGNIVPRRNWAETAIAEGDKFEVVHFVGGGLQVQMFCDLQLAKA